MTLRMFLDQRLKKIPTTRPEDSVDQQGKIETGRELHNIKLPKAAAKAVSAAARVVTEALFLLQCSLELDNGHVGGTAYRPTLPLPLQKRIVLPFT